MKWGRKARGLAPTRQMAQLPKGVCASMAPVFLESAVPILSGSTYLPHSTADLRGVDVPQSEDGDEKEVSV